MKKQTATLIALLSLVIAITVGCGNTSVPHFSKVAFISNRTVTPPTPLFVSNLDGTNVTPIPFSSTNVYYPSISADFKKVVFYSQNNIWIENADGSGQAQLTTTGKAGYARISPNGKKVVYADYTTSTYHFWIINADGSGNLDLTATLPTGMTGCFSGTFSPNSALVAFACYGSGTYGLYTVKTDGTGIKTITTQSNWVDLPSFTPDGKKLVYIGYVVPGATAHRLSFQHRPVMNSAQSAQSASTFGVASINIDGTGATLLVANSYEAVILNSTLYYTHYDSTLGLNQVYKANLDGTNPVSISDGTSNDYLGQSSD